MKFIYSILFCGVLLWGGCAPQEEKNKMTDDGLTAPAQVSPETESSMESSALKEEEALTASDRVVMRRARPDEIGQSAFCPVMKTHFEVKSVTEVADYKGKSYYFCCAMCPPEFEKNPQKYAQ